MLDHLRTGTLSPSMLETLGPWARLWQVWASWAYLKEYLKTAEGADFVPSDREELRILLDAFLLDKAIYELGYELNNRPDWLLFRCRASVRFSVGQSSRSWNEERRFRMESKIAAAGRS